MDEDLACSACEDVVDRIYAGILNVTSEEKEQPLKIRREIATSILSGVCSKTLGVTVEGKSGSRKFNYPVSKSKNTTENDEEESEDDVSLESTQSDDLLFKACVYIVGKEGWKLRSRIAGFYKETTRSSLRKRLCNNALNLCLPRAASKQKPSENCLMSMLKAIENSDFNTALEKSDCASDPTNTKRSEKKTKKKKKKKKTKSKKKQNEEN